LKLPPLRYGDFVFSLVQLAGFLSGCGLLRVALLKVPDQVGTVLQNGVSTLEGSCRAASVQLEPRAAL
jgi:hypothetical protein